MTLLHFQTRAQRMRFELAAASALVDEARDRKNDLQDELRILLDSLRVFIDCKVDRAAIGEALGPLLEAISDADHACNLELDAAHQHFDKIDLTGAQALLEEMRK